MAKTRESADKGGRPKKEVNVELLRKMASEDCTVAEIGAALGCHKDTIYARFSDVLREGRDQGNCSLKRKMFELAMSGNVQMLIWLSKQRLGYKDRQPDEATQVHFNVSISDVPR